MRTLVAVELVSLDGVMQSPGRPDEDTRDGFDLGGWAAARLAADPEAAQAAMPDRPPGALLFGRRTYHDLVGYWLTTSGPNPFTDLLRQTLKFVTSRSSTGSLPHPHSVLLTGEATETVGELKRQGEGDLVLLGSGALLHDLVLAGLVDRFVLTTIPVVLGRGRRLFPAVHLPLVVESSTTSPTGIVLAHYRPADSAGRVHLRLAATRGRP